VDEAAFHQRLAAVIERLTLELGEAACVHRDGNDWQIEPARATASPLWIAGDNAWTLTVGFGRAGARIELGYSSKITPEQELKELEAICDAVLDGRLVERRKRSNASRWRLTLNSGTVLQGSTNWLLPGWPWTRIQEEHFAPYADSSRHTDASDRP